MTKIIAIANQKGGVGKTTSVINIGTGLATEGKRVLLIDLDPQGNLTLGLGYDSDELEYTISELLAEMAAKRPLPDDLSPFILHNDEGVDLLPSDMNLEEVQPAMQFMVGGQGNYLLKQLIERLDEGYDYVLIDCPPSIAALTYNALIAADAVIIPSQAQAFSAKGSSQLFQHIQRVKNELNPSLEIMGILITMLTERSINERKCIKAVKTIFGDDVTVFTSKIPRSVHAGSSNYDGVSIYRFDPDGKVASAYRGCVREVLHGGI